MRDVGRRIELLRVTLSESHRECFVAQHVLLGCGDSRMLMRFFTPIEGKAIHGLLGDDSSTPPLPPRLSSIGHLSSQMCFACLGLPCHSWPSLTLARRLLN